MRATSRIRRFDIFAIFNKVSKEKEMGEKYAKGYGIWMARMIAGKKFGAIGGTGGGRSTTSSNTKSTGVQQWKSLSGKPQTDEEYDNELERRFGTANLMKLEKYVSDAFKAGKKYESIRDCQHNVGKGRFNTGWCPDCSSNFLR